MIFHLRCCYIHIYMAYCLPGPTIIRILGTLWVIHTRDHGHPHVTVYKGTPSNHETVAKRRLDVIEVIERRAKGSQRPS
jgi:hypothetical protein